MDKKILLVYLQMNFPSKTNEKRQETFGLSHWMMIAAIDLVPRFFLLNSSDGASSSRVEFKRIDDESRAQGARSYKILRFL